MLWLMHDHWLFIGNVAAHLVASMSGAASFIFAIIEHARGKKIETWAFVAVGIMCLLLAFDQAWQDEHRNSEILAAQKLTAIQGENFWKNQSYGKDDALRSRDGLLAQNYTSLLGAQSTANKTQNSLAQLSNKILDITKPEKRVITAIPLGVSKNTQNAEGSFLEEIVLLVNKTIVSVHVLVTCDKPVVWAAGGILGNRTAVMGDLWAGPRSDRSYGITSGGAVWSATAPLLVTLYFNDNNERVCTYDAQ